MIQFNFPIIYKTKSQSIVIRKAYEVTWLLDYEIWSPISLRPRESEFGLMDLPSTHLSYQGHGTNQRSALRGCLCPWGRAPADSSVGAEGTHQQDGTLCREIETKGLYFFANSIWKHIQVRMHRFFKTKNDIK